MHAPAPLRYVRLLFLAVLLLSSCARSEPGVLYDKPSAYSPIVVTEEANGTRTLRFERGGARQSVAKPDDAGYVELSYARAALIGLALSKEPRRVLVVGLGGATLPRFVRKYYPDATIDAVDIDPDVVQVAKQFFGFSEDSRMHAHVADGRRFIEQAQAPYDLIFLDAYGASSVPAHMTTAEFLRAVRKALRPDGVVVGNLWSGDHNDFYPAMVRTYEEVFATVKVVPAGGNRIVLALPRKEEIDTQALAQRATRLSTDKRFQFDLGAAIAEEPAYERKAIRGARVLHD